MTQPPVGDSVKRRLPIFAEGESPATPSEDPEPSPAAAVREEAVSEDLPVAEEPTSTAAIEATAEPVAEVEESAEAAEPTEAPVAVEQPAGESATELQKSAEAPVAEVEDPAAQPAAELETPADTPAAELVEPAQEPAAELEEPTEQPAESAESVEESSAVQMPTLAEGTAAETLADEEPAVEAATVEAVVPPAEEQADSAEPTLEAESEGRGAEDGGSIDEAETVGAVEQEGVADEDSGMWSGLRGLHSDGVVVGSCPARTRFESWCCSRVLWRA